MLAIYSSGSTFEERSFFRQLTLAGKQLNIDVYVFTPGHIDEQKRKIYAYYYEPRTKAWLRKWIDYPDLFFDRSRFYSSERFRPVSQFKKNNPQLTFISSPLTNKWNLYVELSRKAAIRPFLPHTVLYRSFGDLHVELQRQGSVYVKPINGTGGRSIVRIQRLPGGQYSIRGRTASRAIIPEQKVALARLQAFMRSRNPTNRYIIQQGLDLRLPGGSVHDYRLLIQKNSEGKWEVTGCVGRVGASGSITSNLHGGGRAIPMMRLLRQWFKSEQKAKTVAEDVYKFGHLLSESLESTYGRLCELALDLAVDRSGRIWLLEVNTKPAREVFARIGNLHAYRKAIRQPLEYARWLYENKK